MKPARVLFLIVPMLVAGCGGQHIVYVHDGARPEKQFGDAPRPALAAAIGGVDAATPKRDEVGTSWVKRHLVLEKNVAPAVIAAPSSASVASAVTSYAPNAARSASPSKLLSPNDFDPNRIF